MLGFIEKKFVDLFVKIFIYDSYSGCSFSFILLFSKLFVIFTLKLSAFYDPMCKCTL